MAEGAEINAILDHLGLAYLATSFASHGINTAQKLSELHDADFKSLGVAPRDFKKLSYVLNSVRSAKRGGSEAVGDENVPQSNAAVTACDVAQTRKLVGALAGATLTSLKTYLRNRGLPATGRKEELVQRAIAAQQSEAASSAKLDHGSVEEEDRCAADKDDFESDEEESLTVKAMSAVEEAQAGLAVSEWRGRTRWRTAAATNRRPDLDPLDNGKDELLPSPPLLPSSPDGATGSERCAVLVRGNPELPTFSRDLIGAHKLATHQSLELLKENMALNKFTFNRKRGTSLLDFLASLSANLDEVGS